MFNSHHFALVILLVFPIRAVVAEIQVPEAQATTSSDRKTSNRAAPAPVSSSLNVDKWAIVIGISEYKHQNENLKNLEYADRDAEELYKLIQTASGGGFAEDHIVKLVNEEATTSRITRALRSFLKKPAKEDVVLIYFSCHGATDPDRPGLVYLMTHDTDPEDVSGTALPMREIKLSLKEYLLSERVVIIADTCHSGAIGASGRKNVAPVSGSLNDYLQRVSEAKTGTALLTSAEANEVSLEHKRWGGGHGVFTHYLLEGMRGKADREAADGVVTVGELFEYVRNEVKRATNNMQHPNIGSESFDRRFPMAITGGISAQEHLELGRRLLDQGRRLDERRFFESARQHLGEAQKLFGAERATVQQARANRLRGLALMALKDHASAVRAFEQAAKLDEDGRLVDLAYYLGMAHAKQGDSVKARQQLKGFIEQAPEHENAPFSNEMLEWLGDRKQVSTRRFALLIGIGDYASESVHDLRGPANDVELMRQILTQHCGVKDDDVTTITDAEASRDNILRALERLRKEAGPSDSVIILYSGHATQGAPDASDGPFLVCHDYESSSSAPSGAIAVIELHEALSEIEGNVCFVLDADPYTRFIELAQQAGEYVVLLGASPDQRAFESRGVDGNAYGAFTYALARALRELPQQTPLDFIVERVNENIAENSTSLAGQTAMLIGDGDEALFPDCPLDCFDYSRRATFQEFTNEELHSVYRRTQERLDSAFPELHHSFGKAFLEKGDYPLAASALERATKQERRAHFPGLALSRGIAQLHKEQYSKAIASLSEHAASNESFRTIIDEAIGSINGLRTSCKHALLIGIDEYSSTGIPNLQGAVSDVRAVKKLLIDWFGFEKSDIKVLANQDASCSAIIEHLKNLVEVSRSEPALFYFSGVGSVDQNEQPTIVSSDGRQDGVFDISIRKMVDLVGRKPTNLVTILDAEWADTINPIGVRRFTNSDDRSQPIVRGIAAQLRGIRPEQRDLSGVHLKIGRVSVYGPTIAFRSYWAPHKGFVDVEEGTTEVPFLLGLQNRARVGSEFYIFKAGTTEFRKTDRVADVQLTIVSDAMSRARVVSGGPVLGDAIAVSKKAFDDTTSTAEGGILTAGDLRLTWERSGAASEHPSLITFAEWTSAASEILGYEPLVVGANPNEGLFANVVAAKQIQQKLKRISDEPLKQIIRSLQLLLERRPDLMVEAHLDLGIAYAALGEHEGAIAALERALEYGGQQGDESLADVHYQLGRILHASNGDLNRAVSELGKAVKHLKRESNRTRARYYRGRAIRALVERDLLADAEKEWQAYLDARAPLGQRSEVRRFLSERRNARRASSHRAVSPQGRH